MGSSYETIWAAERSAPTREYLLCEAQPPSRIASTVKLVMATM